MSDLDLRRYHINSETELIAFLELFAARVPEIIRTVKKMQMRNASLENVVKHQQSKVATATTQYHAPGSRTETPNNNEQPQVSDEQTQRLAQMREASDNAVKVFGGQAKPVSAGEIGQLAKNIAKENKKEDTELTELEQRLTNPGATVPLVAVDPNPPGIINTRDEATLQPPVDNDLEEEAEQPQPDPAVPDAPKRPQGLKKKVAAKKSK